MPGRSWNAEDLLGALVRCHGTQGYQGGMGKQGFSHPELQQSTLSGHKKFPVFQKAFSSFGLPPFPPLPSPCTPIHLDWGRCCHFLTSSWNSGGLTLLLVLPRNSLLQEHPHSHSVVIFKDVQTQSVTPSSREVKESGEGKEKERERCSHASRKAFYFHF